MACEFCLDDPTLRCAVCGRGTPRQGHAAYLTILSVIDGMQCVLRTLPVDDVTDPVEREKLSGALDGLCKTIQQEVIRRARGVPGGSDLDSTGVLGSNGARKGGAAWASSEKASGSDSC